MIHLFPIQRQTIIIFFEVEGEGWAMYLRPLEACSVRPNETAYSKFWLACLLMLTYLNLLYVSLFLVCHLTSYLKCLPKSFSD